MQITLTWNGRCYEWTVVKESNDSYDELVVMEGVVRGLYGSTREPEDKIKYGMSASGKKEYTIKGNSAQEVLQIEHQLLLKDFQENG